MRILTAGGGSGGHVTPVVAVISELRQSQPDAEIRFWCDKAFEDQARGLVGDYDASIRVDRIVSGKLRRYHKLPIWRQLLRPFSIVLPNIIDSFKVVIGGMQSFFKMVWWRPDVVFTKGGYVCLPIGLAAHLLRIPLVIHDSDAHPGLTNRILARFATGIATGAPLEYYPYPKSISRYVGIPIDAKLHPPTLEQQSELKKRLGFDSSRPLIVVTGGGLGARRINDTVAKTYEDLLRLGSLVLVSGANQYDSIRDKVGENTAQFQLHAFIRGTMTEYLAAADVVVARAGMTTILELAALARPTVLIPNAYLTGGHQTKNAAVYVDADAAIALDEQQFDDDPELLSRTVASLLSDNARRARLGDNLHRFAKTQAAREMAEMIVAAAKPNNQRVKR